MVFHKNVRMNIKTTKMYNLNLQQSRTTVKKAITILKMEEIRDEQEKPANW